MRFFSFQKIVRNIPFGRVLEEKRCSIKKKSLLNKPCITAVATAKIDSHNLANERALRVADSRRRGTF